MRPFARRMLGIVAALAAIALGWQLLSLALGSPALPGPGTAVAELVDSFAERIWPHLVISTWRVLAALAIAAAIGVPLGLAMGRYRRIDAILAPVLWVTYPVPKIALLPVLFVLMGTGTITKIALITIIVVFQIIVTVRDAARSIPATAILSVRSLGANPRQMVRHVVLPATLPSMFTSMRLSIGHAIAVLFFAETVAGTDGLGYYVIDAWTRIQYGQLFAGVLTMALLGVTLYEALDLAESRACKWTRIVAG